MGRKKVENPKGNGYLSPCATCGKPSYGVRCRECSHVARPMLERLGDLRHVSTKRSGARNPEWGSGENGKFAVVITKPEYPTHSWWIAPTREAFKQNYNAELPRMMSVRVSGNQLPNTVFD